MEFVGFRNELKKHFKEMSQESHLFVVDVDKNEFWNKYLDSFPEGKNPMFRVRREHDCSCCRHFIKNMGNVVAIKNGKVITLWDVTLGDDTYQVVADELAAYLRSHLVIRDVFLTRFDHFGAEYNFGSGDDNTKYEHFHLSIPSKYIPSSGRYAAETLESTKSQFRDTKNVFKRSLEELTLDSVDTVLDLISQNSLYRGEEWKKVLQEFRSYKKAYDELTSDEAKELFAWENSVKVGMSVGRIRNHSMGTLLVDISNGVDLDRAVSSYERIVAPSNYKRPKAIFTKKMLEEAQKKITEMGYLDSLSRRYATLDDITVNNILFSDKSSASRIQGASDIFAEMAKDVKVSPKKFSKVEEIAIDKFISDVLPTASGLEVYFDGKLISNLVSLIAPENPSSKTMFKWNNNFSWAYSGNMTDSLMKERVKSAGGKVDGDLRFSIQWNDGSDWDQNDLDAHCIEPSGEEIMFSHMRSRTKGQLDVDNTHPTRGIPAVENITWEDRRTMKPGVYKFFVHQFSNRGGRNGFRAEIEFDGTIYTFDYNKELRQGEKVYVAEVTLDANGNFSIKTLLPSNESSREIWGVSTNQFVPVSVVCFSPNYWDEQKGIGNKHYFFMMNGCVNPENPNAFYNEFLKPELEVHKRVFEALGSKLHVKDCNDQLSGVGFSSTKRAEMVVKVKGATERILKIKF